jgi:protein SCO1/2
MSTRTRYRLSIAAVLVFALVGSSLLAWLSTRTAAGESAGSLARPSSSSLYQLESKWETDRGRRIQLRELGGRVWVVAMIFTRCPGACPTLVRELKALDETLPPNVRGRAGFLLFTIDPGYDSVAVLGEYRKKMRLDAERWTLLRGEPNDLRELAATLGFDYQPNGDVGFAHSRLVSVLDPGGEIIHQQAEVARDPMKLIGAIERRL